MRRSEFKTLVTIGIIGAIVAASIYGGYIDFTPSTVSTGDDDDELDTTTTVTIENPYNLPDGMSIDSASYIIFKNGTLTCAKNGETGYTEFYGTDATTIIEDALAVAPFRGLVYIKDNITVTSAIDLIEGARIIFDGIAIMGTTSAFCAQEINYVNIVGNSITTPTGYTGVAVDLQDVRFCEITIRSIYCPDPTGQSIGLKLSSIDSSYGSYYNTLDLDMVSGFNAGVCFYSVSDGNVNSNIIENSQVNNCYVSIDLNNSITGMAVSFNRFINVQVWAPHTIDDKSIGFYLHDERPTGLRVIDNEFLYCTVGDAHNTTYGIWVDERCDATWIGGALDNIMSMTNKVHLISATNSTLRISDCRYYLNEASGNISMIAGHNNVTVYFTTALVGIPKTLIAFGTTNETMELYVNVIDTAHFIIYSNQTVSANTLIYWYAEV